MRKMTNEEIADHLEEMGMLYEMAGVGFKPRAYERAAEAVRAWSDDVAALYEEEGEKGLDGIPGVGKGIAEHIRELLETGSFPEYERLHRKVPVDVKGLTAIEGVGPKTVLLLWKKLKVKTVK